MTTLRQATVFSIYIFSFFEESLIRDTNLQNRDIEEKLELGFVFGGNIRLLEIIGNTKINSYGAYEDHVTYRKIV